MPTLRPRPGPLRPHRITLDRSTQAIRNPRPTPSDIQTDSTYSPDDSSDSELSSSASPVSTVSLSWSSTPSLDLDTPQYSPHTPASISFDTCDGYDDPSYRRTRPRRPPLYITLAKLSLMGFVIALALTIPMSLITRQNSIPSDKERTPDVANDSIPVLDLVAHTSWPFRGRQSILKISPALKFISKSYSSPESHLDFDRRSRYFDKAMEASAQIRQVQRDLFRDWEDVPKLMRSYHWLDWYLAFRTEASLYHWSSQLSKRQPMTDLLSKAMKRLKLIDIVLGSRGAASVSLFISSIEVEYIEPMAKLSPSLNHARVELQRLVAKGHAIADSVLLLEQQAMADCQLAENKRTRSRTWRQANQHEKSPCDGIGTVGPRLRHIATFLQVQVQGLTFGIQAVDELLFESRELRSTISGFLDAYVLTLDERRLLKNCTRTVEDFMHRYAAKALEPPPK